MKIRAANFDQTVDEILTLLSTHGEEAYFGEPVTQLSHALQSAHWAREAHADEELVAAALLHDIGHLIGGETHEEVAIDWLRERGFTERLIALVSGHVKAKRYLVTRRPGYYERLSEASKQTLQLQGGPMGEAELGSFEQSPYFEDMLRLRSWDEMAKDPALAVAGLEEYRGLLLRVLTFSLT